MLEVSIACLIIGIILICCSMHYYSKASKTLEESNKIIVQKSDLEDKYKQAAQNAKQNYEELEKKRAKLAQEYDYEKSLFQSNLDKDFEIYQQKYESDKNKVENEYNQKKEELEIDYNKNQLYYQTQKEVTLNELEKIKATLRAAQDAQLREQKIKEDRKFYTLQLDQKYIYEIGVIKSIESMLSDPRPLRMLVWTTYYSKKANDLCARVVGPGKITGIYKITCLDTNQSYIGQARDIRERFREHMKCGLGIDTPAGNKLYAAMQEYGLESFSFELLEDCSSELLNEKEKYYIDLYDTYNFGFNSNKGNSK